jgi:hypothetical protein
MAATLPQGSTFRPIDPQADAGSYLLRLLAGQTRSPFRGLWDLDIPPLGHTLGHLPTGRPIVENLGPHGGQSTHLNMRFSLGDPSAPQHYVIPTIYGGQGVTEDEAVEIFRRARGIDPDTGMRFPAFPSDEAAAQYEHQLRQRGYVP